MHAREYILTAKLCFIIVVASKTARFVLAILRQTQVEYPAYQPSRTWILINKSFLFEHGFALFKYITTFDRFGKLFFIILYDRQINIDLVPIQ